MPADSPDVCAEDRAWSRALYERAFSGLPMRPQLWLGEAVVAQHRRPASLQVLIDENRCGVVVLFHAGQHRGSGVTAAVLVHTAQGGSSLTPGVGGSGRAAIEASTSRLDVDDEVRAYTEDVLVEGRVMDLAKANPLLCRSAYLR